VKVGLDLLVLAALESLKIRHGNPGKILTKTVSN
jgi:hypothetical protein